MRYFVQFISSVNETNSLNDCSCVLVRFFLSNLYKFGTKRLIVEHISIHNDQNICYCGVYIFPTMNHILSRHSKSNLLDGWVAEFQRFWCKNPVIKVKCWLFMHAYPAIKAHPVVLLIRISIEFGKMVIFATKEPVK